MWKQLAAVMLLIGSLGCVEQGTMTQDISDIKSQIWRIQKDQAEQLQAVKNLEAGMSNTENTQEADLLATLEEINGNINILFERVRDLNQKMTFILSRMSSDTGPIMQPTTNSGETETTTESVTRMPGASPDALFSTAYTDYVKGNYEIAAMGFRDFVKSYSESDKADNALYWLGLCYYEQEKYRDAIREFERVINDYPDSDVMAPSMLRKGLSLFEMNSPAVGVLELQDLIKKFPLSQEARIARKKLDELQIKYQ